MPFLKNIKPNTKFEKHEIFKTLAAGCGESPTVRNSFYFGFSVHGLFRVFDLS